MTSLVKAISIPLFVAACVILMNGCYPMPHEEQYSTIPTTNNPDVVGSHSSGLLPGGGF